jgi:hypothetical protein
MLAPGAAFSGPVLVIATSADAPPLTWVVALALLFSSLGSSFDATLATLVMKSPGVAPLGTCATSVKVALLPDGKIEVSQLTVPPEPTASGLHDQAGSGVRLTKVSPAGSGSVNVAELAASGPVFVIVIV